MSLSATVTQPTVMPERPLPPTTAVPPQPAEGTGNAAHTPDQAPDTRPEAKGDKDLAQIFATAAQNIARNGPSFDGTDTVNGIPPQSTFGQWWGHLHKLLETPQFVEWASAKHIDLSKPLSISSFGHLTATASGRRQTFRAADKDPLWDTLVAPVLRAAGVVAAGNNPLIVTPGSHSSAPFSVVANFYGEDAAGNAARANALAQTQAFRKNAANDPDSQMAPAADLGILDDEKTARGDLADLHGLSAKLTHLVNSGSREVEEALKSTTMAVDPDSSFSQQRQLGETTAPTLEQFMLANNWNLPKTAEELENFRNVICSAPLPVSKLGSLGGALSWPVPLENYEQKSVYSHFNYNLNLPALRNDGTSLPDRRGALGYLAKNMQFSASELRNPLQVIDTLVNTPKARELESALQAKMGDAWKTSTPHDWILTAIATTLDTESLFHPKPNHVAGYNLADDRFSGKPLGTIKQGLADHLVQLNRVSPELAPVAAHLLLARAAPELLVQNIPNDVSYGSTAWVAFKAAVARIETYSPGATAGMTFSQVLAQDAKDPITDFGHAIQDGTSRLALIEWGKLHGTLPPREDDDYPQAQIDQTKQAFKDKIATLETSLEHLTAKVPTQRELAVEALKKKFGVELPYELKCFRDNGPPRGGRINHVNPTPPRYSMVDFYLSNPKLNGFSNWVSEDRRFSTRMLTQLSDRPDPIAEHKSRFAAYKDNIIGAHATVIKNQISRLPLEDRKNLEFGEIRVFVEGQVSKTKSVTPAGTWVDEYLKPGQPMDNRRLIIQTLRDGKPEFYEMSSQKGQVTKRDDLKENFKEGLQGKWVKTPTHIGEAWKNTAIEEQVPSQEQAVMQAASPLAVTTPASFTSARSNYLAERVSSHTLPTSSFDNLFELTKTTTTFDEEKAKEQAMFNFIMGLSPGGSAAANLVNGEPLAALGDVMFDGIMYMVGSAFGKGARALRGPGRSVPAAAARGVGQIGAAGPASRSFGRGVRGKVPGLPASQVPNAAAGKFPTLRKLQQSGMNNAQFNEFVKRADVAEGTYKVGTRTERIKTTAIQDESTGDWFHYDAAKNRAYGTKIEHFAAQANDPVSATASASASPGNNFQKSLAKDKVIKPNRMQDLKMIADEVHTYVDNYKGPRRLNIVAHGHGRDFVDKLLRQGTHVVINKKQYSAKELVALLKSKGVDPSSYDNIRLLICHSGEGGSHSFARLLQQEIKRPVKAFEGTVTMNYGSTYMTQRRNELAIGRQDKLPGLSAEGAERWANDKLKKDLINKITPEVNKAHGEKQLVNVAPLGKEPSYAFKTIFYKPVYFQ
nr:hypothetical protein [uncultured Pseudomonas sp.]